MIERLTLIKIGVAAVTIALVVVLVLLLAGAEDRQGSSLAGQKGARETGAERTPSPDRASDAGARQPPTATD